MARQEQESAEPAYSQAGVNIGAAAQAIDFIKAAARTTFRPEVLTEIGGFSGLFALGSYRQPVLVSSIDGVGTKLKVAFALNRHDTIGIDLVSHCVNDILTCGARPLFFLDYLATGDLDPQQAALVVGGIAEGCRRTRCALIGGETAEMPGLYQRGEYDLAGTIVGIVERDEIINGSSICAGDVLIGLASAGLHTNGYSLARRIFASADWYVPVAELGRSIGEELLQPHLCYFDTIEHLRQQITIKGMAHITGGGFLDNIPRVLPQELGAQIQTESWPVLPVFTELQRAGNISTVEMYHVFNMGIGFVVICSAAEAQKVLVTVPDSYLIGSVVSQEGSLEKRTRVHLV